MAGCSPPSAMARCDAMTGGRRPHVSRSVSAMSISAIKEMAIRSARIEGAASLTWGLPSFPTPEHIRRAVEERLEVDPEIGKYALPDGLAELRRLVAAVASSAPSRLSPREIFTGSRVMAEASLTLPVERKYCASAITNSCAGTSFTVRGAFGMLLMRSCVCRRRRERASQRKGTRSLSFLPHSFALRLGIGR